MTFRYDPKTKRAKVTIYAGKDHLGRQRQKSATWQSPNERQAKREASQHEARLRQQVNDRRTRGKTLNGLIDDWQEIRDANDSPSTVRKRAGIIRRIRDNLGPVRLDDLTAKHVDQWMTSMRTAVTADGARQFTDTTIANHWSTLRAILRQGSEWDAVTDRATKKAKPPKRTYNRRPSPPTPAAVAVLLDAARPDLRVAGMLGAYAGLRRGEAMALRWPDIGAGVIHVRHAVVDVGAGVYRLKLPKTDEPRDVWIDDDLAAALAEHRVTLELRAGELGAVLRPDAFVLPRLFQPANGSSVAFDAAGAVPRPVGWLTLEWTKHARRMGAPGVRFHDLRHFYATQMLALNVPVKVVQEQLGHSQMRTTTDIYGHSAEGAKADAAEAFRRHRALPSGGSPAP